jgi:hypothetical protein
VPASFETSRKRAARLEEEARRREAERLEREYGAFKKAQIDEYIAKHPQQFEEIKKVLLGHAGMREGWGAGTRRQTQCACRGLG